MNINHTAAAALGALALISCVTEKEDDIWSLGPGDPCPHFSVTLTDGTELTTASLEGKRTMIVFFDTSCPDCREELPVIQAVYERTLEAEANTAVICISRGEPEESVLPYWHTHGFTVPCSAQPDRTVYNMFASSVIPRIYTVGPSLTITHAFSDSPLPSESELLASLGL